MLPWVFIFIHFLVLKRWHTKVLCISLSHTSVDSVTVAVHSEDGWQGSG